MTDEYMIMDEKIIEKKLRGSNTRLIGKKNIEFQLFLWANSSTHMFLAEPEQLHAGLS